LDDYLQTTGMPPSSVEPRLRQADRNGWLDREGDRIRPSARGFDFLSDLQALFLPE
jgi:oxygen-independent coproporphyrinogen-3 oxidase